jgi:hypothetical protein
MKIVVLLAVLAVAVVLGFGLMTLFQPGYENRVRSNKLMQLRIAAQAVAIVIILIAFWAAGHGPG